MKPIYLELTVRERYVVGELAEVTADDGNGSLSTVLKWVDMATETPEKGAKVYLDLQYEKPEVVT